MDSNERIDRGLHELTMITKSRPHAYEDRMRLKVSELRRILIAMKTVEPPVKCTCDYGASGCRIHNQNYWGKLPNEPKETSGYSTNKDELEWAHDETPQLCKVTSNKIDKKITAVMVKGEVFLPKADSDELLIWLERAKQYVVEGNTGIALKCINEAIELIYGKVEE